MVLKKNIYFLNNKIISCDTIVPVAQEIAIKIITLNYFYIFNKKPTTILKNKNLYSILSLVGTLKLFGWEIENNNKILDSLLKF